MWLLAVLTVLLAVTLALVIVLLVRKPVVDTGRAELLAASERLER